MARGGVGWRLLNVVVGQTPPLILAPPLFLPDRVRLGVPILPVQGASELTGTTMHGFCYQLIRVEASGSRDQAVALVPATPTLTGGPSSRTRASNGSASPWRSASWREGAWKGPATHIGPAILVRRAPNSRENEPPEVA